MSSPTAAARSAGAADSAAVVRDYHERTKHRLERYARGPETLDWSAQPEPFRWFDGAPKVALPLSAEPIDTPFSAFSSTDAVVARPFSLRSLGALFELALGLSAWKEYGPDRWALRCNPSSGNLHPTEGYLICRNIPELDDGVYHYISRDHALERRGAWDIANDAHDQAPRVLIGLTSIHWREAWKYGERAFRYCQLDLGHALGALRYAAAVLGWRIEWNPDLPHARVAALTGIDRPQDFANAEPEDAEVLLELMPNHERPAKHSESLRFAPPKSWSGHANLLDRHPMYRWPVIDQVAEATQAPDDDTLLPEVGGQSYPPRQVHCAEPAGNIIRQRRSAQHFDPRPTLAQPAFYTLMDSLLPRKDAVPADMWPTDPCIHPILFVHRVAGIAPGLYAMPRRQAAEAALRQACRTEFEWTSVADCPGHIPLYLLLEGDSLKLSKTLHCHQAIAADCAFALGLLAEFDAAIDTTPWRYRQLYWEAGLLGQILYLEAEALGIRGTGIGCYFDDVFHEVLGITDTAFQSMYHFTVGFPLTDTRILTLPPYANRDGNHASENPK